MDSMHVYFQQSLHCTLYHTAVTFQIQGLEGCLNQPSGEMRAGQQVGLHAWIWFHTLFFASSSVISRNLFWTVSLLSFLFQVSTLMSMEACLPVLTLHCLFTSDRENRRPSYCQQFCGCTGDTLTLRKLPSRSSDDSSVIVESWVV